MSGKWERGRVAIYSTAGVAVLLVLLMAGSAAGAGVLPLTASSAKVKLHGAFELQSPIPSSYGHFGFSVAVGGWFTAVGAPGEASFDNEVPAAGNVYVFNTSNGDLVYILDSPNELENGFFGWSVAASGNTLVIGAPGEDSIDGGYGDGGNAYQWNVMYSEAVYAGAFLDPYAQNNGAFGFSVAASGTNVLVGAPSDAYADVTSGLADLYSSTDQALLNTFDSVNPTEGGYFGWSVALSGAQAYVGAPDELGGHAYIFTPATSLSPKIYTLGSPIGQSDGTFGISVAADSKYLVVGASSGNESGVGYSGAAYVYRASNGNYERTLESPVLQSESAFGGAVAISGSTALIGAPAQIVDGVFEVGAAFVFDAANGKVETTLYSPNSQADGFFGDSVRAEGSALAVGAPGEMSSGILAAGIAYIY